MSDMEAFKEGLKIFAKEVLPLLAKGAAILALYIYGLELVRYYHFAKEDTVDFWIISGLISFFSFIFIGAIYEAGYVSLKNKKKKK